jgi:hypothetical protein
MSDTHQDIPPPGVPAAPADESATDWSKVRIPPLIARANLQFKRDLPRLLQERPGQYVAYSGEQCLGFDRKYRRLLDACFRRGLTNFEFTVRRIEPWDPDEVDPEEYIDESLS